MTRPYVKGTEAERFWPKVNKHGDVPVLRPDLGRCWEWTAGRTQSRPGEIGYGIFRRSNATNVRAHRWAYEELVGPIPDGLEPDHLCGKTWCVRPSHIELTTHAANSARAKPGGRSWRSRITHCPQGHEYTPENTRTYNGSRQCLACRKERGRAWGATHTTVASRRRK